MIQNAKGFHGLDNEDPHDHISTFTLLSNIYKLPGVDQDEVRRVLFPFSLRDKAMTWFTTSGGHNMETFDEMVQAFVEKFFPPSKMEELQIEMHQFVKHDDESFKDAWDRYQDLLKKCPPKLIEKGYELQLFYNGLNVEERNLVNASAANGTITGKSYAEVKQLFDTIAKNNNIAPMRRGSERLKAKADTVESNATNELAFQIVMLTT